MINGYVFANVGRVALKVCSDISAKWPTFAKT